MYAVRPRNILLLCFVMASLGAQFALGASQAGGSEAVGIAADLELRTFGDYLQAGKSPKKSLLGLDGIMVAAITANYNIGGQYAQVLRLCKYSEWAAKTNDDVRSARQCRLSALLNLGRYMEAEDLLYTDGNWLPDNNLSSPKDQIYRLRVMVELNLAQGNIGLAAVANEKLLALLPSAKIPPVLAAKIDPGLVKRAESLRIDMLNDEENSATFLRARIAYFQQDFPAFALQLDKLLNLPALQGTAKWSAIAIDHTDALLAACRT